MWWRLAGSEPSKMPQLHTAGFRPHILKREMQSRRTALVRIAAATASAVISPLVPAETTAELLHHLHEGGDDPVMVPHEPSFFGKGDYEMLSRVVDLIIPKTETPGAVDAGVPYRIDQQVRTQAERQAIFRSGFDYLSQQAKTLHGADFVALSETQQVAVLQAISTDESSDAGKFFKTVKDLTIDWYYSSEPGLVEELGFKGNTFRASFPGCTHPEHWPNSARKEQA